MLSEVNLHRFVLFRAIYSLWQLSFFLLFSIILAQFNCFTRAIRRAAWLSVQGVNVLMWDESTLRCRYSLCLNGSFFYTDQTWGKRLLLLYFWVGITLRINQIEKVLPLEKWKFALYSLYLFVTSIEKLAAVNLCLKVLRWLAICGNFERLILSIMFGRLLNFRAPKLLRHWLPRLYIIKWAPPCTWSGSLALKTWWNL